MAILLVGLVIWIHHCVDRDPDLDLDRACLFIFSYLHYKYIYFVGQTDSNIVSCFLSTVCPGSSDHPEKILNTFASENEFYTIY